ncbi:unnamed protein product [Tilletia controversa]|nr:unnamed protein product [Tilletia controversa]
MSPPTRRVTRRSAVQAPQEAEPAPPSYAAANPIVVDSEESELSDVDSDAGVGAGAEQVEPQEEAPEVAVEVAAAQEQVAEVGDEEEVEEVVPQVAELPCVHCHKHKMQCKVFPESKRCQGCSKGRNGCNVDGRSELFVTASTQTHPLTHSNPLAPDFRGEHSLLRQRIYRKLFAAALKAKPYVPVRTNASNDWTAKYLEDILGEEARSDADVRQHLGRDMPIAAATAPAALQPLLASGSGTSGPVVGIPSYSLNNIDNPSAHKRALDNNKAAIDHHERALKRARRDRLALQAMEFDEEEEEKEEDSEEDA